MDIPISQTLLRFGFKEFWERSWLVIEDELRRRAQTTPTKESALLQLELGWTAQTRIVNGNPVVVFRNEDVRLVGAFREFLGAGGTNKELAISLKH